jgi:putative oxidoreductase
VARLGLGGVMLVHGAQKVGLLGDGGSWSQTAQMLTGMIGNSFIAHLVIAAEFLGSIALIIGFLSRFAAASLAVVMTGAIVLVHGKNGFFMGNGGYEFHLVYIALCIVTVIRGSGALSIDALLCKMCGSSCKK